MIIGLGHQAQVGKDTIANILVEQHGFKRLAFADKLKEMALDINPFILGKQGVWAQLSPLVRLEGWERAKELVGVREFLQNLGLAARTHLGDDVWVRPVIEQMTHRFKTDSFVITDVRFPNEFEALQRTGARLVKVIRLDVETNAGSHISETALADAPWDLTFRNNGSLEWLPGAVDTLLDELASTP